MAIQTALSHFALPVWPPSLAPSPSLHNPSAIFAYFPMKTLDKIRRSCENTCRSHGMGVMATSKSTQIQVTVLVDPETLDVLDEMANSEMLSRSDILRRLIRRGLEMERLIRQSDTARKAS